MRMSEVQKVNLAEKFGLFSDYWHPRIAGDLNDSHIKVVKVKGEFTWHHHDNEDELFLVVKGTLLIKLRDGDILLHEGEFAVIPRGVEHKPVAEEEAQIMLIEPKSLTRNTGNIENEMTVAQQERI